MKNDDIIIDDFLKPMQKLAAEVKTQNQQNMHVKGPKMPKIGK